MTLHDSVFGACILTPLCTAFLNTREHYRLKHVSMNHADILYPSVCYSRREHCIAVMELARRWAQKLTQDDRLIDLIALAGSYHDVGHVSLSHTMDQFLVNAGLPDHEERSTHIVRRVNKRLRGMLSTAEEDFVCNCISGKEPTEGTYPTWAYHIVHQPDRSLPDVDRIVYLCHDSYKLGVECHIDVPWITENIYIDQKRSLGFKSECTDDLEYIIELRTSLFSRVFQHPVVIAYQTFLLSRFSMLYTEGRLVNLFSDFAWLELTDVLIWNILHQDEETMSKIQSYN